MTTTQRTEAEIVRHVRAIGATWQRNGATIPELCDLTGLDRYTVTRAVERLRVARVLCHGGGCRTGLVLR